MGQARFAMPRRQGSTAHVHIGVAAQLLENAAAVRATAAAEWATLGKGLANPSRRRVALATPSAGVLL